MARKNKIEAEAPVVTDVPEVPEVQEQEQEQEVHPLIATINNLIGNPDSLVQLQNDEELPEDLSTLITIFVTMHKMLGDDAVATQSARENLLSYKPPKVKKAKKAKEPKEKAFKEGKFIREILEGDDVQAGLEAALSDERISQELNVAITTYLTLKDAGVPEAVLEVAYNALTKSKKSTGERGTLVRSAPHNISVGDETYPTLSAALRSQGITKEEIDEESGKPLVWNKAWSAITSQFRKGDEAEYDGNIYTRVWLSEEDIATDDESE